MDNKRLYSTICQLKKNIPLFLQPWWLDAVCKEWDVAITKNGDEVSGVWPYPIEKKINVSILRNPILTPYLGPHIFYPEDIKDSKLDSFEYETISGLIKMLPDAKVWHLALQPGMKQVGLFKTQGLKSAVQQTFLIDLKNDEEALLTNMKDTLRRNIKQAEKEVTITNSPDQLKQLFHFHKHTLTQKGRQLPYTLKDLQQVMDACLAHESAALWVAKAGNDIQAMVWQVWDAHCSYYLMGAQNHDTGNYKAMSALLWHTIKEAKKRGNATFDLEGSMDEGVERFFRNFGGQRTLYLVLQKNDSMLWKIKNMVFR